MAGKCLHGSPKGSKCLSSIKLKKSSYLHNMFASLIQDLGMISYSDYVYKMVIRNLPKVKK